MVIVVRFLQRVDLQRLTTALSTDEAKAPFKEREAADQKRFEKEVDEPPLFRYGSLHSSHMFSVLLPSRSSLDMYSFVSATHRRRQEPLPLSCARAARDAHSNGAALEPDGCGFWTEITELFGPKSGSMALEWFFCVHGRASEQGQPSVQAPGALAASKVMWASRGAQRGFGTILSK